jgi:hypothetical protein
MPPPAAQPPPPPAGPPAGGLGPASPLQGLFSDLPAHLGTGWQQIDLACRAVQTALRSRDFLKTPAVVAVLQSSLNTMQELLSHYTSGTSGASAPPRSSGATLGDTSDAGSPPSSDADAQPSADTASDSADAEMS